MFDAPTWTAGDKGPEVLAFAPHTVIWVAQQPAKFLHILELFPNLHN